MSVQLSVKFSAGVVVFDADLSPSMPFLLPAIMDRYQLVQWLVGVPERT